MRRNNVIYDRYNGESIMMFVENYHYVVWDRQHIIPIKVSLCMTSVENPNWSLSISEHIAYTKCRIKVIDRLQELRAIRENYMTEITFYTNKVRRIQEEIDKCKAFRARRSIL